MVSGCQGVRVSGDLIYKLIVPDTHTHIEITSTHTTAQYTSDTIFTHMVIHSCHMNNQCGLHPISDICQLFCYCVYTLLVMSISPVCKDDGQVKVTLRVIGSVGVLVRWQGLCPSSTLRFSDVSTHGAETSITLGSKTSLFFMSRAQLTAGRDYQVCVDVLCGDVTCSGCSSVNIG